jgi:DNA-binding response OmpR family regulator
LSKGRGGDHFGCMSAIQESDGNGSGRSNHDAGAIVILCAQEHVRDVIAYWLSREPARVLVAEDGYQAAKAVDGGCNWLVTDRVLPPWPGLDTFTTLRYRHPKLRIAYVENNDPQEGILARATGANVLLRQPLDRRTVSKALLNGHA